MGPAILMFGDWNWRDDEAQEQRCNAWQSAVRSLADERAKTDHPLRVVILEFGAGDNVPTVRRHAESFVMVLDGIGADARLVRTNPVQPLGDNPELRPGAAKEHLVLSIMA